MINAAPVVFSCDPGANGALAVLRGDALLAVEDMPTVTVKVGRTNRKRVNEQLLAAQAYRLTQAHVGPLDEIIFVIEHVGPMPKDGPVQAFGLGLAFGLVRGVMAGRNVRAHMVRPAEWKKALRLKRDKDESRQRALQLWPAWAGSFARKMDDGRAEAALIGYWFHEHGAKA